MVIKPKFGILFFTSGWFREVGLQTSSSNITEEVDKIGDEIVTNFSQFMEPVYSGVIFSEAEARDAAREIKAADVDGIIICPLMWCEDQIFREALKMLPGLPLIICGLFPYRSLSDFVGYQEMIKGSGMVGILQMSGFLRREGYFYRPVSGYCRDPEVYEEIKEYCLALAIARKLKKVRCGIDVYNLCR